jgi:hypothetical protein
VIYSILAVVVLWPLLREVLPARLGGTRGRPAERESLLLEAVHTLEDCISTRSRCRRT